MKKSYVENRKGLKVAKFTSLLRIHALISRRGYLHIPNVFGSQGGCACYSTYHLVFKDWWTPRLVACTVLAFTHSGVATARRRHAGSHFAHLDRPSHRGPYTSRPGWRQLSPFSDGRDPETFPRRSCPFFGRTQIPIQ